MKYEEIFDIIVKLDFIGKTTNNDNEFVGEVQKLLKELKEQENIEL